MRDRMWNAMVDVKICGLSSEPDIDVAIEAGARWIGLVVVEASPRYVAPERAVSLAEYVLAAGRSPVFVSTGASPVHGLLAKGGARGAWVQVHAMPDLSAAQAIAAQTAAPVIDAGSVSTRAEIDAHAARGLGDMLLLDAKPPKGAAYAGGHGARFDWTLLKNWTAPRPWLLAGGLTPDNVAAAIEATNAPAVDVSSGVESAPGVKDRGKIRAFIAAAQLSLSA